MKRISRIEEHGPWVEKDQKWILMYIFPRKYIMEAFIKHIKSFKNYDRIHWKIAECHKLAWDRYFKKLSPRYRIFVCYQWYKRMNHVRFEFENKKQLDEFITYANNFEFNNVIIESYLGYSNIK